MSGYTYRNNSFDIHFAADYYPYGKTLRYFETAAFEEKFLTTQHERDRETGFDYRGARYYDADLGRFLSLDPLAADFPTWSAYNYVLGNPVSFIDPDGREAKETRWTKNHVLMNQAFGGSSGLNDLIEEQCDDCPDKTFQMENAPEPYEVKQYNFEASPFRSRAERDAHNNRIDHQIAQRNLMNGPMRQFVLIGDGLQIGSAALPTGQVGNFLKLGKMWNAIRLATKGSNSTITTFKSFTAFKSIMGPAGQGKHWHHIVEQHADNIAKFGSEAIHNTKNVISIPGGFKGSLHSQVTGYYNSIMPAAGMRVRDYVKTLSYEEQYKFGIEALKKFGWTP